MTIGGYALRGHLVEASEIVADDTSPRRNDADQVNALKLGEVNSKGIDEAMGAFQIIP